MPTRLESFLVANGIQPSTLARVSGVSRQHIYRLRHGTQDPTRLVMRWITQACSRIVRRHVHVTELFDLEDES